MNYILIAASLVFGDLVKLTNSGNIYFPTESGHWVSENQRRIAEILKDYDPQLELQWIPPNERNTKDEPFRVVHRPLNQPAYLVCVASECDERLLAKVFQSDAKHKKQDTLSYIESHNAAVEALKLKEKMESLQEDHDLAASIIRSNKASYKHRGVDFERPRGRR